MAELTTRTIKHVYFRYVKMVPDMLNPGEEVKSYPTAFRGETVELLPGDLALGERLDAFFTDAQVAKLATGVTAEAVIIEEATGMPPEYIDGFGPDPQPEGGQPPAIVLEDADLDDDEDDEDGDEVMDLEAYSDEELPDAVKGSTIPDLLEAVDGDIDQAQRVLEAEKQATGGDPRKGLEKELTAIIEGNA